MPIRGNMATIRLDTLLAGLNQMVFEDTDESEIAAAIEELLEDDWAESAGMTVNKEQ